MITFILLVLLKTYADQGETVQECDASKDSLMNWSRVQKITYLITHLNNFNLPLNGGYFTSGSNQVGVFITAFL